MRSLYRISHWALKKPETVLFPSRRPRTFHLCPCALHQPAATACPSPAFSRLEQQGAQASSDNRPPASPRSVRR